MGEAWEQDYVWLLHTVDYRELVKGYFIHFRCRMDSCTSLTETRLRVVR